MLAEIIKIKKADIIWRNTRTLCDTTLAPMAVEILLCRCSAQKIEANSGKKLLKNNSIHNQRR